MEKINLYQKFLSNIAKGEQSFQIIDQWGNVAFQLNAENKTYHFFNETMKAGIERGVQIQPGDTVKFANRSLISSPAIDPTVPFALFSKAMAYYFFNHIEGRGFKITP